MSVSVSLNMLETKKASQLSYSICRQLTSPSLSLLFLYSINCLSCQKKKISADKVVELVAFAIDMSLSKRQGFFFGVCWGIFKCYCAKNSSLAFVFLSFQQWFSHNLIMRNDYSPALGIIFFGGKFFYNGFIKDKDLSAKIYFQQVKQ